MICSAREKIDEDLSELQKQLKLQSGDGIKPASESDRPSDAYTPPMVGYKKDVVNFRAVPFNSVGGGTHFFQRDLYNEKKINMTPPPNHIHNDSDEMTPSHVF